MEVLFSNDFITVRKLRDCDVDYRLFVNWLSDPDVCEYYEGRTKPYGYAMVLEKFQERARGNDTVVVGIVEHDGNAIGWLQFYPAEPGEYHEEEAIDRNEYPRAFGIDIVIGDKTCWNKGIGTRVMQMTVDYLQNIQMADIIFIAPQLWNKRAIRCYEKSGFHAVKVIPEMELHDNKLEDGLLMILTAKNR